MILIGTGFRKMDFYKEFGVEKINDNQFNTSDKLERELEITKLPDTFMELCDLICNVLTRRVSKRYNHLVLDSIRKLSGKFEMGVSVEFVRYLILSGKSNHHNAIQMVFSNHGRHETKREIRKLRRILLENKIALTSIKSYVKLRGGSFSGIIVPRTVQLIDFSRKRKKRKPVGKIRAS